MVNALRSRFPGDADEPTLIANHLNRVTVRRHAIELQMTDGDAVTIALPGSSRARTIIASSEIVVRPMRSETRSVLLRWIALGRGWVGELAKGGSLDLDALAEREGCSRRQIERAIAYAFLSPDLVRAIAEGRLPRGVSASVLADAPMEWSQQWRMLSLEQPRALS